MRLCFVLHRAAPFPGGTEIFVQAMAEEAQRRGHQVLVLAGEHQGDLNGVRMTSDQTVLDRSRFDLVVVHGATDGPARNTLARAAWLQSPVLYMLVAHRAAHVRRRHLHACRYLGWSTPLDLQIITAAGLAARAVPVRHAIAPETATGAPGFRAKHGIAPGRQMFLACGGYWPNKRMRPRARLFERARTDALLVTTGYHNRARAMPPRSDRVLPLLLNDRAEALSALREADCYLMHSRDEGFGLVLLEAMVNATPWIANATGGATVLAAYGQTYRRDAELSAMIETFTPDAARVARAKAHALAEYSIPRTLDDIEAAARSGGGPVPEPSRWGRLVSRVLRQKL